MHLLWTRRHLVSPATCGALVLLSSCGPLPRLDPPPPSAEEDVTVLGLSDARYWGDEVTPEIVQESLAAYRREVAYRASIGQSGPLPPANYLAISGGGENGAFGAGLLTGWTVAGTRPEFKVVTGISTGALIAPFAFLGPAYDPYLKAVYTQSKPKDILERRWLLFGIFGDGMASNEPLYRTIESYITPALMQEIATQYEHGRLLLIATTDLDTGRPVIWNIGRIASSGQPGALTLIHKILLASAAIPVAFPPVMIDVQANGTTYQEMNVDGGASAQVFVYPPGLRINSYGISRERHVYVIRNARLDPEWTDVNRQTLSIAGRATSALIQTQGIGDLYRIYTVSQRDDVDFNLAFIPPSFNKELRYPFDPDYMKALFEVGYDMGRAGYSWAKVPPGFGDDIDAAPP